MSEFDNLNKILLEEKDRQIQDYKNLFLSADQKCKELQEKQRWRYVDEEKPKMCGVYNVARWFVDGERQVLLTDSCYFDGSSEWHDDTRVNHSREYVTDKIVAWMPLPEKPGGR